MADLFVAGVGAPCDVGQGAFQLAGPERVEKPSLDLMAHGYLEQAARHSLERRDRHRPVARAVRIERGMRRPLQRLLLRKVQRYRDDQSDHGLLPGYLLLDIQGDVLVLTTASAAACEVRHRGRRSS